MQHVEHLFPYMGAKGNLADLLMPVLRGLAIGATTYVEPFCGSAAIGLRALYDFASARHVWNDADPAIMAIWSAVRDQPNQLIEQVKAFTPSVRAFGEFKSLPPDGFRRLAIAYMSWCGNKAGCRGGQTQRFERIDELWQRERIAKKIRNAHAWMQRGIELRCEDFAASLAEIDDRTIVFADPPYRVQNYYGAPFFSRSDHERLADLLGTTPGRWVLTYGDHPDIRRLYGWAHVEELDRQTLLISARKPRRNVIGGVPKEPPFGSPLRIGRPPR